MLFHVSDVTNHWTLWFIEDSQGRKALFSATRTDATFVGAMRKTICRTLVLARRYSFMRFNARCTRPRPRHC